MTGRGRGRPPARQSAEPAVGPGRRSTRQQQAPQPQPEPQIDPAITAPQTGSMPPPPLPPSRRGRSQENARVGDVARRGTRRDARPDSSSMVSISSLAESSQEPPSSAPLASFAPQQRQLGTPIRASSAVTSTAPSPSQLRAKAGLMRKNLDRLLIATSDAFAHLSIVNVPDLDDWNEERKANRRVLDAYRASYFAHDPDPYANLPWALSQLGLPDTDPLLARFSQIISMANLTSLLDSMVESQHDHPTAHVPAIQALDSAFPRDFNAHDVRGDRVMDPGQVLEQVLEIRTQLLIINLQVVMSSDQPFNPYQAVLDVFCRPGSNIRQLTELKDNPDNEGADITKEVPGFPQAEMPNMGYERILTRIISLCSQLPNEVIAGGQLQIGDLEAEYPFDKFVEELQQFVKGTFNRTRALLPLASSAPSEFLNPESAIQSQLAETLSQFGAHERGIGIGGVLQVMSDIEQQGGDLGRLASQDIIERSHEIQAGTYPPISSVPYPPGFSSYAEPPVQSNGALYAQSAAQVSDGRKRRAPNDGDLTQAPAKKPRARRKNIPVRGASGALPGPPATPAGESQYPPPPSTSAAEPDFDAVSARSREISAANRKAKEPQVRSAWVRNDVKHLVKAVDTYKCKWSTIQKEIKAGTIPFEIPRDQQALRDKARLLKQDFLKADGVLPASFDLVVLGRKEINAIIACGKNPWRKEADVIDGVPVNTEYQPEGDASPARMPALAPASAPAPEAEAVLGPIPEAPMDAPIDADAEPEPVAA